MAEEVVQIATSTETSADAADLKDVPVSTETPAPESIPTLETPTHWSRNEALGFDVDSIGWLENKGFENPQAAITSQRELEKKMGGPPEMLQKWFESDDEEGKQAVFRRLGKPETVEGYKVEFEEGAPIDSDTLEWFKKSAHDRNLTGEQVQGMALDWNTEVARIQAEQQQAIEVRDKTEETELRNSWGTKYDERLDYGHRGLVAHGLSEENIDSIQAAVGPKLLAEFAARVADTMGEDTIAAQTDTPAFGTSEEQIQNSINELAAEIGADTARFNRYRADHSAAKEATDKDFRKMKQLEAQKENLVRARLGLT